MIVDIQTQEIAIVNSEAQVAFVAVADLELMYVGGGTTTGSYF